jgi:hypothetical protein
MAMLFTTCPVTGQEIATGIETDPFSFSITPTFVGKVRCPICKTEHSWTKETAWLLDSDKPSDK